MDQLSVRLYEELLFSDETSVILLGEESSPHSGNHWRLLRDGLFQTDQIVEFRLRPLRKPEMDQLVEALAISGDPRSLTVYLMDNCGGIPLYTLQMLSHMESCGEITLEMGRWVWTRPQRSAQVDLPTTLAAAILDRLESLSSAQRQLLDHLALFEDFVPLQLLESLIEASPGEVIQNAQLLSAHHYVEFRGALIDPKIRLSYGLLRLALTQELPIKRRRAMHRLIAAKLEQSLTEAANQKATSTLVCHYIKGGLQCETRKHLPVAIAQMREHKQFQEASSLLKMADSAGMISVLEPQFSKNHLELLYLTGQLNECIETVQKALRATCSEKEKGLLLSLLGRIQISRGLSREGVSVLQQALANLDRPQTSELAVEVWADLLSSLSCTGQKSNARHVAAHLLQLIRRSPTALTHDKLYHAVFLYYSFAEGWLSGEAITWERKSIKQAIRSENQVRVIGRIFNVALALLRLGRWNTNDRLTRYCELAVAELGNPELAGYVKTNHFVKLRKKGKHREALLGLDRLIDDPPDCHSNRHLQCEYFIECAKNLAYSLQPEEALVRIEELDQVPLLEKFRSTIQDGEIVRGWVRILLGEPERAKEVVQELSEMEDGRIWLLSGQANVALGRLEEALEDSRKALRFFPKSVPYYRVRARLLQAEILTDATHLGDAGPYITDALETSKREFYFPLLARSYMFKGKWLTKKGDPLLGRAHCLRALQVARRVERPGLLAEIFRTLGTIEAIRGRKAQADEQFDQALQILRERYLRLSPRHRPKFAKAHMEPIENERVALTGRAAHGPPRSVIDSRDLTKALVFAHPDDLPALLMKSVRKVSPLLSANLLLRTDRDDSFRLAASLGRCRHSGKHVLPMLQRKHPVEPKVLMGKTDYALAIPMNSEQRLEGFLYIERGGGGISELEFDSLTSIAETGALYLQGRLVKRREKLPAMTSRRSSNGERIVGSAPSLLKMLDQIKKVAPAQATVLIEGETGTGKELVAKAIHEQSGRLVSRYKPLNCAALPDHLVESELFGHVRGAFTGATRDKPGLFEAASGGTLFLDEISNLPLSLQNRLLRVLEEKEIRRVGDTAQRKVNTRVIAATNESLLDLVQKGRFRRDLYHRLNVFRIEVPPLRNRLSDLSELCSYFLDTFSRENGRSVAICDTAVKQLETYDFPGNVRELKNLLESLFYTVQAGLIRAEDIALRLSDEKLPRGQYRNEALVKLLDQLVSGSGDFWELIRDPFLNRDLSRRDVRWIVAEGLAACGGSYTELVEYFGMKQSEYKRFLAFLTNHDCKVDFRPYRRRYGPRKQSKNATSAFRNAL